MQIRRLRAGFALTASLSLAMVLGGSPIAAGARTDISSAGVGSSATSGAVGVWGNSFMPVNMGVPEEAQSGVTAVAAGQEHALALKDGQIIAWGDNFYSQVTVPAEAQVGVTAIDARGHLSGAVASGRAVVWGGGNSDQQVVVQQVPADAKSGVSAIAVGGRHALALKEGRVIAWGSDASGQATVPSDALSGVSAIAAGDTFSLALRDGKVIAWGASQLTPPQDTQSGIVAIAAGTGFAVALTRSGRVVAWGDGSFGRTVVPTEAQSGVSQISAGSSWMAVKDGKLLAPLWPSSRVPPWTAAGTSAVAVADAPWALVISNASNPPGPVTNLRAHPRTGGARVTWGAPADTGGPFVVTYEYQVGSGSWIATTEPKAIVKGPKGKRLTVNVRAVNQIGAGPSVRILTKPK